MVRITHLPLPCLVIFTLYASMYLLLFIAGWSLELINSRDFLIVLCSLSFCPRCGTAPQVHREHSELLRILTSLCGVHATVHCTSNPIELTGPASWAQSSTSSGTAPLSAWASLFLAHMFYYLLKAKTNVSFNRFQRIRCIICIFKRKIYSEFKSESSPPSTHTHTNPPGICKLENVCECHGTRDCKIMAVRNFINSSSLAKALGEMPGISSAAGAQN